MREELMQDIWVVTPQKTKDNLNHVHVTGYTDLRKYHALCVSGNEGLDLDKYGLLPVNRVQVLFMNEPFNEVINDEDGMYLTEPTADSRGLYQNPEFVFTHKHIFQTNRVYTASKKVL